MTIYLDIILLENICMNYIILFATGIICKIKVNYIRIFLSSLLGGVYAVISFLNVLQLYSNFFLKMVLSIAMIYLAFAPKNLKKMSKELILFYLTSFTFGGVAFALLYVIKPQDILMKNGILIGSYPIKIVLLGGLVGFVILTMSFKAIKGKFSKKDMFCDVEIYWKGKVEKVHAMLDTGNLLREPITGTPVIIVEQSSLSTLLPKEILDNLEKIIGGDEKFQVEQIEQAEYISRFRVIPFSSLGKENGLLLGVKVDYITVKFEDQEKQCVGNVIVGIYDKSLTKNGNYTALISLDILERKEAQHEPIRTLKA